MSDKRIEYDSLADALRDAIADSELSFAELERRTGVLRQTLMTFSYGEGGLRLVTADKLARYFGMKIVVPSGEGE